MKGFFSKLKDFSPKLKVSEILFFSKSQNRWKKACLKVHKPRSSNRTRIRHQCTIITSYGGGGVPGGVSYLGLILPISPKIGSFRMTSLKLASWSPSTWLSASTTPPSPSAVVVTAEATAVGDWLISGLLRSCNSEGLDRVRVWWGIGRLEKGPSPTCK